MVPANSRTRRIYVVDDDDAVREALMFRLRAAGIEVTPFTSGIPFLEAAPTLEPGIVLLDLRMPEMDGMAVLEALTPWRRKLPVVMVTGHGDVATAVLAMRMGALDLLEKPFSEAPLIETLSRVYVSLENELDAEAARASARDRLAGLSPREGDVLQALAQGHPNKVVAHQLGLSVRTVEMHRASMMERLRVRSLPEALRLLYLAGDMDWA